MTRFVPNPTMIRNAQERLARLGHDPVGDTPGVLGDRTSIALQAFQRQRGLPITGQLDALTWGRLEEAGWVLGNRLLFVTTPPLRGDDVAELQEALGLLGFNSGRIDGIFGPLTQGALKEFQRNCALEPSGELTRASLDELVRLSSRVRGRRPVTEAHDNARHVDDERQRLVIVHGVGPVADALSEALATSIEVRRTHESTDVEGAALANRVNAAILIAVSNNPQVHGVQISYYESYRSHSTVGKQLATAIAKELQANGSSDIDVAGMSLAILRETTMPALTLVVGESDVVVSTLARVTRDEVIGLFDRAR